MSDNPKCDVDSVRCQFETTAHLAETWSEFVAVTADGRRHELRLPHGV